jgi:hypothetical protein
MTGWLLKLWRWLTAPPTPARPREQPVLPDWSDAYRVQKTGVDGPCLLVLCRPGYGSSTREEGPLWQEH